MRKVMGAVKRSLGAVHKIGWIGGCQTTLVQTWSSSTSRAFSTSSRIQNSGDGAEKSNIAKVERRRTIFSGIQPTGIPHLGNYFGALQNWVQLQNDAMPGDNLIFSIVGLHALTMPQDPKVLLRERSEMMATLLAIGLDPERCTIFHQDQVSQHAELAWILNCITPFGKLNRMTTWKSKIATSRNSGSESDVDESQLSLGLFAYPVLQAADILLYKATHVPVGEDQVQHLELSRDIADIFNRSYKKRFFPAPQHIITPTKRVLSLRDPSQKMSKSAPNLNSRILITDTPEEVESKIKRAVTDGERTLNYDPIHRPGVSNLLSMLSAMAPTVPELIGGVVEKQDPASLAELINHRFGGSGSHLKKMVTEAIVETLRPIQAELGRLKSDPGHLDKCQEMGRSKAAEMAESTMRQVRKLVGIST